MSLAIDIDRVTAVLLQDGWHGVTDRSFTIDSYEYLWGSANDELVLGGGREPLIPAVGFQFRTTGGVVISGPLTAVLAVETD